MRPVLPCGSPVPFFNVWKKKIENKILQESWSFNFLIFLLTMHVTTLLSLSFVFLYFVVFPHYMRTNPHLWEDVISFFGDDSRAFVWGTQIVHTFTFLLVNTGLGFLYWAQFKAVRYTIVIFKCSFKCSYKCKLQGSFALQVR
jgi:hypothetical protein